MSGTAERGEERQHGIMVSAPDLRLPRIDLVVSPRAGGPAFVITGTPSASPVPPALPVDTEPLAEVVVRPATEVANLASHPAHQVEGSSFDPLVREHVSLAFMLPESPCILVCRVCGDGDDAQPIPFESQAARGLWASGHTRETGHNRWIVVADLDDLARHFAMRKENAERAAAAEAALAVLDALPAGASREQIIDACARARIAAQQAGAG